jgi:hypothetical protein
MVLMLPSVQYGSNNERLPKLNKPKRHHWWPMAQSRHWTDLKGLVFVTRANGHTFRSSPLNLGVESELYTRFADEGEKDTAIEEWFAEAIDGPATKMIQHLLDDSNISRQPFRGDPRKAKTVRELGFRVNPYVDRVFLPKEIRRAIACYIAALFVRHPRYLAKLTAFHNDEVASTNDVKNRALDNMLGLYQVYVEKITNAVFVITRRIGSAEYVYSDGGLLVEEPWRRESGVPFDIHAPLTPDVAIQVLPVPYSDDLETAAIMEATNQGVARQNRIILGGAQRFVFSRQEPPIKFITHNFGKPAPKNIGYQIINGRIATTYEKTRI